jgi:hypothetical protein
MKRRLGTKIIFSVVVFLVSLELALQAAHLIVMAMKPEPKFKYPGAPVVLCVGDSMTYGLWVAEEDAYPQQLQGLFEQKGMRVNVYNDGIPGQNTSELRRRLPRLLAYFHPRVVIILGDANNDWNKRDTVWSDLSDGMAAPGIKGWYEKTLYLALGSLRTAKLCSYAWNRVAVRIGLLQKFADREGNLYFHRARKGGDSWDLGAVLRNRTERDLTAMVDMVRQAGATPILMNYVGQPHAPMNLANEFIADVAKVRAVPLVDNDARIRPLFWKDDGTYDLKERNRLFVPDPEDTHLAGPGYALAAQTAFSVIMDLGIFPDNKPAGTSP